MFNSYNSAFPNPSFRVGHRVEISRTFATRDGRVIPKGKMGLVVRSSTSVRGAYYVQFDGEPPKLIAPAIVMWTEMSHITSHEHVSRNQKVSWESVGYYMPPWRSLA